MASTGTVVDVAGLLRSINRTLSYSSGGMRKLKVEMVDHDQPYTDMVTGTIYVPRLAPNASPTQTAIWLGYIWHEAGHHHPSQKALVDVMREQNIAFGSPLGQAINCLDDYWQEQISTQGYRGAGQALDAAQGYHCDTGQVAVKQAADVDNMCVELLGLSYKARTQWQHKVALAYKDWDSLRSNHHWDKHIPRMDSWLGLDPKSAASDLVELARELLEEQTGEDSHDEEQQGNFEQEQEAAGKSDGESDDSGASGRSEGEGAEGRGEGTSDDGDGKSTSGTVSYKDLMGHEHSMDANGERSTTETHIVYDHEPSWDYEVHEKVVEIVPTKINGYQRDNITRVYDQTSASQNRVSRLFQAASQNRPLHQQKKGKLTTKHLARSQRGDDRVFHKKINKIDKESEVYILVDCSGSMGWAEKFEKAWASGIHLVEILNKAGIPNKIAGFQDDYTCQHFVIKDWHERPSSATMIERASNTLGGCNADGDSILHSYRDLIRRPGKRKILIVLSDGEPASTRYGDCYTHTQEVVKTVEQKVECYGIGIMDNAVEDIYKHNTVLRSASEIERCLTDVVKAKILK